jgi:hypothetical protein
MGQHFPRACITLLIPILGMASNCIAKVTETVCQHFSNIATLCRGDADISTRGKMHRAQEKSRLTQSEFVLRSEELDAKVGPFTDVFLCVRKVDDAKSPTASDDVFLRKVPWSRPAICIKNKAKYRPILSTSLERDGIRKQGCQRTVLAREAVSGVPLRNMFRNSQL